MTNLWITHYVKVDVQLGLPSTWMTGTNDEKLQQHMSMRASLWGLTPTGQGDKKYMIKESGASY